MKRIDFHSHAFADTIAEKAVSSLRSEADRVEPNRPHTLYTDGTVKGMTELMDRAEVDRCVLLSVATKQTQTKTINEWIMTLCRDNERLIPFGAVHPDGEWEKTLEYLAENGFYGIKLHGDFQHFYADEERMLPLYRKCGELGLTVLMHMGFDYCSPDDMHSSPERLARVLDKVGGTRFVAAHMGGVGCEKRAAAILSGAENVWVDTAYAANRLSSEDMAELIEAYGADRVLFASDSPWNDPRDCRELIEGAVKDEKIRELIFYKNAEGLLALSRRQL